MTDYVSVKFADLISYSPDGTMWGCKLCGQHGCDAPSDDLFLVHLASSHGVSMPPPSASPDDGAGMVATTPRSAS